MIEQTIRLSHSEIEAMFDAIAWPGGLAPSERQDGIVALGDFLRGERTRGLSDAMWSFAIEGFAP